MRNILIAGLHRFAILSAVPMLMLTGCSTASPPPITITNPMEYLAQSINPDGNPNTPLTTATPWSYTRFDFGHYQASQTYLRDDTTAQTIWSYPPFGKFIAANGDGGEVYKVTNGVVNITGTQDGGQPGMQQFGSKWWMFDQYVPNCAQGWRYSPDGLGRACTTTVTYPPNNNPITADTVISEHYDLPNLQGKMERSYMAKGWGRLGWQSFRPQCTPPADLPARAPTISYDGPPAERTTWLKCDERLNTNIAPLNGSISGDNYGWKP